MNISGAKGKKLTSKEVWNTVELWNTVEYQTALSDRSAEESPMVSLKYCFEFGQLRRIEIEAVRVELLEKVIAYNICRAIAPNQDAAKKFKKAG